MRTSKRSAAGQVAPALERYRQGVVEGALWARPQLSRRDRSLVTVAALIARNQTAEQERYIDEALENGVRPSEVSEVITQVAFYAGWPNAFSVPVAKEVFDKRGK
jgi:4-carboxymuconolactone decarboxylase